MLNVWRWLRHVAAIVRWLPALLPIVAGLSALIMIVHLQQLERLAEIAFATCVALAGFQAAGGALYQLKSGKLVGMLRTLPPSLVSRAQIRCSSVVYFVIAVGLWLGVVLFLLRTQ
jgi:hypothetical protein